MSGVSLLVDGHAHWYPIFQVGPFLEAAEQNFRDAARRLGVCGESVGVLALMGVEGRSALEELLDDVWSRGPAGWSATEVREDASAWLSGPRGERLVLLEGAQTVTREGVEVLALGARAAVTPGRSLDDTISEIREALDAVPVLPWGFGKWRFRRGREVAALLARSDPDALFLGDSAARLRGSPAPSLLRRATARGFRVLPGSDPLPLRGQELRIARAGFVLRLPERPRCPGRAVIRALRALDRAPRTYRAGEAPFAFLRSQIAMQIRKRRLRSTRPRDAGAVRPDPESVP